MFYDLEVWAIKGDSQNFFFNYLIAPFSLTTFVPKPKATFPFLASEIAWVCHMIFLSMATFNKTTLVQIADINMYTALYI